MPKLTVLILSLICSLKAFALEESQCIDCQQTLPWPTVRVSRPLLQVATVFGEDTRRPVVTQTKTTSRWPIGRTSTPDGRPASGSFISPCLFLTAHHVMAKDDKSLFDYLDITNETSPDGRFLIPIEPIVGKFVKSGNPKINSFSKTFETEGDLVIVDTYPNCRGAVDGMIRFVMVPPSREKKENDLVMYTSAYDPANPHANGKNLIADTGCDLKYRINYSAYHDCPSTDAASGAALLLKDSIAHPESNEFESLTWLAAGMNVNHPLVEGFTSCSVSTCNVAIDAGAINRFARDLVEADFKRYREDKDLQLRMSKGISGRGAVKAPF